MRSRAIYQTLPCSKCHLHARRSGGRWCHACHAADEAQRRARQRAARGPRAARTNDLSALRAELDALRAVVAALVGPVHAGERMLDSSAVLG